MDILLWRPGVADLGEEKHGETGGRAEMPLRFEFDAAGLWLGKRIRR
jgi:hypothetical protein